MSSSGAASSSARSVALERFLLQGAGDGGEARLGGASRGGRTCASSSAFERGHRVAHRLGERYVVVDDDQRLARRRAAGRRPCRGPRGR